MIAVNVGQSCHVSCVRCFVSRWTGGTRTCSGRTMDMLFPGLDTQNTTMFLRKIYYIIDVEWLYPFF